MTESLPESSRVFQSLFARAQTERIPHIEIKQLIDDARGKTENEAHGLQSPPSNRLRDDLRDLADRMTEERPDDPLIAELRRLIFRGG
jgi:hypothetical protein